MHRRPRALPAAAACLAAAATATACGGGGGHDGDHRGDPSRAVAGAVVQASAALADDRGSAFCDALTAGARTRLRRRAHAPCRRIVTLVSTRLDQNQRAALRHLRVGAVDVRGSRATVRDSSLSASRGALSGFIGGDGGVTRLQRASDGRWRIAG